MRLALGVLVAVGVVVAEWAWARDPAAGTAQEISRLAGFGRALAALFHGPPAPVRGPTMPAPTLAAPRRPAAAVDRAALEAYVEEAALAQGLPPELFRALVQVESGFNHRAVSPKGAIGLAQLLPQTAAALGVDPWDPRQNARGGAIYLRQMHDRFGCVESGLWAYNAGPGNVERGRLPRETAVYVQDVLRRWRSQR